MSSSNDSPLLEVIRAGHFWTLSEAEVLDVLRKEFSAELNHLKTAYSVRSPDWKDFPNSPSRILFPNEECYDEVNRTLVGVLALRWINDGDYEKFSHCQPEATRLTRASFDWIFGIFREQKMINSMDYKLYALVTSMVSNDLGKCSSFKALYEQVTGDDITNDNHDLVLYKGVMKGIASAIERLRPDYREDLIRGIKLGGGFNVGQFAQAENAPASLTPLLEMTGHEEAWNLRWMEQILDIAGAAGHENPCCARKLIEPIFQSYRHVYEVAISILQGQLDLRAGYDENLTRRYHSLVNAGWVPKRELSVNDAEDRTLMRLFCMGNVASAQSADLYYDTFYSDLVGEDVRQQWISSMNHDGTCAQPAIQPTCGPGMYHLALAQVDCPDPLSQTTPAPLNSQQTILAVMMRYTARALAAPPHPDILAQGNVTVIERDFRVAIKDIILSDEFKRNPGILDTAPLPTDAVANTL